MLSWSDKGNTAHETLPMAARLIRDEKIASKSFLQIVAHNLRSEASLVETSERAKSALPHFSC